MYAIIVIGYFFLAPKFNIIQNFILSIKVMNDKSYFKVLINFVLSFIFT